MPISHIYCFHLILDRHTSLHAHKNNTNDKYHTFCVVHLLFKKYNSWCKIYNLNRMQHTTFPFPRLIKTKYMFFNSLCQLVKGFFRPIIKKNPCRQLNSCYTLKLSHLLIIFSQFHMSLLTYFSLRIFQTPIQMLHSWTSPMFFILLLFATRLKFHRKTHDTPNHLSHRQS